MEPYLSFTGGTCLGAAFCTEGGTSGAGGGGKGWLFPTADAQTNTKYTVKANKRERACDDGLIRQPSLSHSSSKDDR